MASTAITLTSSSNSLQHVNTKSSQSSQQKPLPLAPTPQTPSRAAPHAPLQPGTWRHPQMDLIARRQKDAAFTSENVRAAMQNGFLFAVSLAAPNLFSVFTPQLADFAARLADPYGEWAIRVVRIIFLINFIIAFRPLAQRPDDMNDIPLTPSQRALLGLKPSNTPLTPGSQIATPPRYSRSATPKSSSSDRRLSGSPLSGSPLTGRGRSGSMDRSIGYGGRASSGSPLVREALTGSAGRRLSFDVSGGGSSSSGLPSTPTPGIGPGRASVGLNNKWLYERSRGSPNGRSLFS